MLVVVICWISECSKGHIAGTQSGAVTLEWKQCAVHGAWICCAIWELSGFDAQWAEDAVPCGYHPRRE